jgi:hypothetical protein
MLTTTLRKLCLPNRILPLPHSNLGLLKRRLNPQHPSHPRPLRHQLNLVIHQYMREHQLRLMQREKASGTRMSPESEWDKCVVRRHIVTARACGVARERGLGKLVPLSGYLGGSAEAEGVVLGRSGVKGWVEVDCFYGGDDGDARGNMGIVGEGDAIGVVDLESR